MAPAKISVLISSFPGLTLSVPYDKDEPLHFIRDRVSSRLCDTTACVDPEVARLYIDGQLIPDYEKSMDHYTLFGDTLTYRSAKVPSFPILTKVPSKNPALSSSITVQVMTTTGQSIKVEVSAQAPVKELKLAISNAVAEEVPAHKQQLYFNETELHDEKRLADYSIASNATVHMLTKIAEYSTVSIYVKTLTRTTCAFQVNLGQTVYQLKKSIARKVDIPADEQRLIFRGKQLEDDHILDDCHIGDGCTVAVSLRLAGGHDLLSTFADVSTAQMETMELSDYAPRGRTVGNGTNIELKCRCTPTYNVFSMQDLGLYELGSSKVKCPNCNSTDVKPITVGFLRCAYRTHGVKADWTNYKSDWIEVTDADQFQRYDPSDQVAWRRLGIESKPLFRSKTPVCTICVENILGHVTTLSCGHQFHKKCIASWKLNCPNCRARASSV